MVFLLLLSVAFASGSAVVPLTDATFDAALAQHGLLLVEFFAPWCGHCKSLAPEYAKASAALASHVPAVVLASVDATTETATSEAYEIRGFPTIKWFRDGVAKPFTGGRTAESIVAWVKKKAGPPVLLLGSDRAALDSFITTHEVVVVRFAVSAEDDDDASSTSFIAAAAAASDDILFAVADSSLAAARTVPAGSSTVALFKRAEEEGKGRDGAHPRPAEVAVFSGDTSDSAAIAAWVQAHALPLIVEFSASTQSQIFAETVEVQLLIFCRTHSSVEAVLREVAPEFRGNVLFVTVTPGDDASRVFSFFDVDEGSVLDGAPVAWLWDTREVDADPMKYALPSGEGQEMTADVLREFLRSHSAGTLKRHFKSEAAPSDGEGGGAEGDVEGAAVVTVVGSTFDDVVLQKGRDVLIEFYAPWCGHCKKLAPTWQRLGEKLRDVRTVVIAKMDATANGENEGRGGGKSVCVASSCGVVAHSCPSLPCLLCFARPPLLLSPPTSRLRRACARRSQRLPHN